MTPANCLYCAARHAKTLKSNYVVAARHAHVVFQGPDLRDAENLDGATLYFFCEPCLSEVAAAAGAGVKAVYYGVSKHDALRLGLYPAALQPQVDRHVRRTILKEYFAGI